MRTVVALVIGMFALGINAAAGQVRKDPLWLHVYDDLKKRFASEKYGRYMIGTEPGGDKQHHDCSNVNINDPLFHSPILEPYRKLFKSPSTRNGATVLECEYDTRDDKPDEPIKYDGGRGWVVLLVATAENLADRLVKACRKISRNGVDARECIDKLIGTSDNTGKLIKTHPKDKHGAPVWGSNNLQFPITGFVSEGRDMCHNNGVYSGKAGLIGFRHGVTIQYADSQSPKGKVDYCSDNTMDLKRQRLIGLENGTYEVFQIGRLAGIHRDCVFDEPQGAPGQELTPDTWQNSVIDNEVRAIQTGDDRLMVYQAAKQMNRFPEKMNEATKERLKRCRDVSSIPKILTATG